LQLSTNAEILRRTSIILFCDYACESASLDLERLGWLLRNHFATTISLADEPPVRELLAVAVHREPESSDLFLRAVVEECESREEFRPEGVRRLLGCLEGANQSQSGQLLLVLVPRLLRTKYLALSRMAAKIASRRLELLLALGKDEALTQITRDDLKVRMR
jgi:huntingtin